MCGIAGSYDRETAFKLYEKNLERGRYSAGLLVSGGNEPLVVKTKIPFRLDQVPTGGNLYLFHSRAPTGRSLEYSELDTHPFRVGGIYVAHNGIITNAEELAFKYEIDYSDEHASMVDSYVIPYIIQANKTSDVSWVDAIIKTLEELKGTFGLWIYLPTGQTLICRSGSTLYTSHNSFSSSPVEGLKLIPDGGLFLMSESAGMIPMGLFKTKPMYFIT